MQISMIRMTNPLRKTSINILDTGGLKAGQKKCSSIHIWGTACLTDSKTLRHKHVCLSTTSSASESRAWPCGYEKRMVAARPVSIITHEAHVVRECASPQHSYYASSRTQFISYISHIYNTHGGSRKTKNLCGLNSSGRSSDILLKLNAKKRPTWLFSVSKMNIHWLHLRHKK